MKSDRRSGRSLGGWRGAAGAALGLGLGAWAAAAGCGARSELYVPAPAETADAAQEDAPPDASPDAPPTGVFCAEATYDSGPTDLSMFVLLDRSGSMQDDNRWDEVTAALSAFVDDPGAAGLGMGLQYYPFTITGDNCDPADYAAPAVPIGPLPGNGPAVKASLAGIQPFGETPTLPALRGGVEYARGVVLANPKQRVVIALVTDGAPNACASTAQNVAALAGEAATTAPQVLTYVIGLATGYTDEMALMASAGGTGKPILVDDGASAAQKLVDAMLSVKSAQDKCVFGVPIPPGATPAATDLSVRYRPSPSDAPIELPLVADFASCSGEAFYPDDLKAPGSVSLCPAACDKVHAAAESQVTVTAGCGMGTDGGPPDASPDAAQCPNGVDFSCVTACDAATKSPPSCIDGAWTCPPGTFTDHKCTTCPPVPHGCCKGDGTWSPASCVNGAWTCPPGASIFGSPGCQAPDVCAATLPCAFGSYCDFPDDSCSESSWLGKCQPVPPSCPALEPEVCGCDGLVHASPCASAGAATDIDGNSGCATPAATFPCGGYYCAVKKQVCRKTTTLGAPIPDAFECVDIPPGCGDGCGCKLCDVCPQNGPCGSCGPDGPEGGVYLQCTEVQP